MRVRVVVKVPLFDPHTRSSEPSFTKLVSVSLASEGTIDVQAEAGFAAQPIQWVDATAEDAPVVSPDKKVTVKHGDSKLVITRGSAKRTIDADIDPGRVGFAAGAVVVQYRVMHGCGGAEGSGNESAVYALP